MIDAKSILGSLLEAGLSPSASQRIENATGPQGMGGMSDMLSKFTKMAQDAFADPAATAQSVGDKARQGDPMAVGGIGALAGAVLGGLRGSPVKGAIGGSALAILGNLAFSVLQGKMAEAAETQGRVVTEDDVPITMRGPKNSADEAILASRANIILQAMINAAKADGQIDGAEMQKILGKLDQNGADAATKDLVLSELKKPLALDHIVNQVQSPDLAVEVYAASLLAIEVDTPAEVAYLKKLAQAMRLDPQIVARIHQMMGVPALA